MIRHIVATIVVLLLSAARLHAQGAILTVNVASANVHKSPSTGSPIVGTATRGTAVVVTRELGSWVKVSWPKAQNGIGYIHIKMGTISHAATLLPAPAPASRAVVEPPPARPLVAPLTGRVDRPVSTRSTYVRPSHIVGLGGFGGRLSGSNVGYGGSARAWKTDRLGFQIAGSRYAVTAADASGRVTSLQFQPSVLYAPHDSVSDYLWLRPYVGSGLNIRRQTWTAIAPSFVDTLSENRVGFQVFGGSEITLASAPQIALSADVAYNWSRGPFAGIKIGGLGLSIAAHWYVK
jgi:opacity protein-like surface antigen